MISRSISTPADGAAHHPAAVGGAGEYGTHEPFKFDDTQGTLAGISGGGFRSPLSCFSAYFEACYRHIPNVDVELVPIAFGLVLQ